MENENAPAKVGKPKSKKKKKLGKIRQIYKLHQKGLSGKEIAEKMKISERLARSYIWRSNDPEKYKELLKRYFAKKKEKIDIQSKEKPESA